VPQSLDGLLRLEKELAELEVNPPRFAGPELESLLESKHRLTPARRIGGERKTEGKLQIGSRAKLGEGRCGHLSGLLAPVSGDEKESQLRGEIRPRELSCQRIFQHLDGLVTAAEVTEK
jgi:hypothetical protein